MYQLDDTKRKLLEKLTSPDCTGKSANELNELIKPFAPSGPMPEFHFDEAVMERVEYTDEDEYTVLPSYEVDMTDLDPGAGRWETVEQFQWRTGIMIPFITHSCPDGDRQDRFVKSIGKRFRVDESGQLYFVFGHEKISRLCNFHILIESIMRLHFRGGLTQHVILAVEPNYDFRKLIEEKNFSDVLQIFIDDHPQLYVPPEFKAKTKQYFQEYAAEIYSLFQTSKVQDVFLYHGWERINGKMRYLPTDPRFDGSDLNFPDLTSYQVHLPNVDNSAMAETWRFGQHILSLGIDETTQEKNSLRAILPIFLYIHMGLAAKLFEDAGYPLQFLLMITGTTGSLKTSICKAIAEPFNPGGMLNFQSTDRAIENYRRQSIDMTMIVDDIFSLYDKGIKNKFDRILRAFGDSIGRAKAINTQTSGNFNATERTIVRSGCIVTGEHRMNSQQSDNLRTVQVEVDPHTFDRNVLREIQDDNNASRMRGGVSRVQNYFASFVRHLENNYERYMEFIANFRYVMPFQTQFSRQENNFRLLHAMAYMIIDWGMDAGAITQEEGMDMLKGWDDVLDELMKQNEMYAQCTEPYQQFLSVLRQGIGTGNIMIADDKAEYISPSCLAKYVGFQRLAGGSRQWILDPDSALISVRKIMEHNGQILSSDKTSICRALYQHGITVGYGGKSDAIGRKRKRYLKRFQLNGVSTDMMVIDCAAMNAAVGELM